MSTIKNYLCEAVTANGSIRKNVPAPSHAIAARHFGENNNLPVGSYIAVYGICVDILNETPTIFQLQKISMNGEECLSVALCEPKKVFESTPKKNQYSVNLFNGEGEIYTQGSSFTDALHNVLALSYIPNKFEKSVVKVTLWGENHKERYYAIIDGRFIGIAYTKEN